MKSVTHTVVMAALVATAGCSDNVSPEADWLSGRWTFVIDVTAANGPCTGEEAAPPDTSVVTILHQGRSVSITGPWGSASGHETLNGNITGMVVSVGGSYGEDGGTTTTVHTLSVASDIEYMSGTEAWSWSGPGGTCTGGTSDVTAERIR